MQQRIGVRVQSDDLVVRSGMVSLLRQRPELALLDDADQAAGGVRVLCVDAIDEAALAIMRRHWRTESAPTVLVVGQIRQAELLDVIECGVATIVRRQDASPERMVHAIGVAHRGNGHLPSDLLGGFLSRVGQARRAGLRDAALSVFSERETEVVKLLAEGLDTREISAKLCYSERTVKNVLHDLMLRLNLRNRAHAVAYAAREGYLR
jgi:DNA-binding NarL/FixJ family response regulator